MSKYESIKVLSDEKFNRLTGIYRNTFNKMLELLALQYKKDRVKDGRNRIYNVGRYASYDA